MDKVTVRDLRSHGGRVLERVARGETLTVTRSGRPVAELHPLPPRGLRAEVLLDRWRGLPRLDPRRLREDLDTILDATVQATRCGTSAACWTADSLPYTCDPEDFSGIEGLEVVAVPIPDRPQTAPSRASRRREPRGPRPRGRSDE